MDVSIEVTRSEIMEGPKRRYCMIRAMLGTVGQQFVCGEETDGQWTLLTAIGKPGSLGLLRVVPDLEACEDWSRWIAEQVLIEDRPLRDVFNDVRANAIQ